MTDPGREKYSESTLKLSERYGIDPARLDAILGKPKEDVPPGVAPTREWIEERRIHQPNVEPVTASIPAPTAEPFAAAASPRIESAPASANIHTAKGVRAEGSSLSKGARSEKVYNYQKQSTSPLTWIIGLAILGLLAIMFFMARGCEDQRPVPTQPSTIIIDSVVKTDTLATTDTTAVSETAAVPDVTTPKPASRPRAMRRSSASGSRNVALSTTSSFSATEKLAELKADGNKNAKIQRVTKNGVTLYRVKTK